MKRDSHLPATKGDLRKLDLKLRMDLGKEMRQLRKDILGDMEVLLENRVIPLIETYHDEIKSMKTRLDVVEHLTGVR